MARVGVSRTVVLPSRRVLRVSRPDVSRTFDVRVAAVSAALLAVICVGGAVSVGVGDFPVPLADVVPAVFGYGDADALFIVNTLRLPRVLTAVLVGAAFGLSGAVFQSLARNPLASPDIIGVNAGAAAVAVLVIVVVGGTATQIALGALAGALATALAIYLLAYRRGVTGYRLVLVGIGVTAMLSSVTSYLLTRAEVFQAQRATVWLTGSLNARAWEHVRPVAVALAVLLPLTFALGRHLRALQLGDDAARGLGTRVETARAGLMLSGVGLAAVATASAGPVAFVALVSPQIARRLARGGTAALGPAALSGAALVLLSDLVARRLFAPTELPVGVITAVLGAPYLIWLLARANRIGRAG
ncbi:MAG: FecCD family ABC transporter permease [Acidimicrobiia bacterium]